MIRLLLVWLAGTAIGMAQVRQGGVYQISAESLDSGGGAASSAGYSIQQTLPSLGSPASSGGAQGGYALWPGFSGQLGGGGSGAGAAAFASWQVLHFGSANAPGAGPNEDDDGDGVPNVLEFAFNLLPYESAVPLAQPGATSGIPWIRLETFGGDNYMTMDYIQRKDSGLFMPEFSTDLANWSPAAFTLLEGPVPVTLRHERIKVRLGTPVLPGGKVYYRLAVLIQ